MTSNGPTLQGKMSRRLCLVDNLNLILDESRYPPDEYVMVSYRVALVMNGVSRRSYTPAAAGAH